MIKMDADRKERKSSTDESGWDRIENGIPCVQNDKFSIHSILCGFSAHVFLRHPYLERVLDGNLRQVLMREGIRRQPEARGQNDEACGGSFVVPDPLASIVPSAVNKLTPYEIEVIALLRLANHRLGWIQAGSVVSIVVFVGSIVLWFLAFAMRR